MQSTRIKRLLSAGIKWIFIGHGFQVNEQIKRNNIIVFPVKQLEAKCLKMIRFYFKQLLCPWSEVFPLIIKDIWEVFSVVIIIALNQNRLCMVSFRLNRLLS